MVAIPSDLKTRELSISPENVLFFSGPGNYLSALYPSKLVVDGNEYNSVEHYYQACKLYTLINKEAAAELKAAATPIEVKKATKGYLLKERSLRKPSPSGR
uniref:PI-PLC Y-box domain-containing protein n=2 Tax=Caenorhabditis japonica TaxID=281687 RepID=A0A8R1EKF8_CAEJA